MVNFIICDDEKIITESVKDIIIKVMFKTNVDYKIHVFNSYNDNFWKTVKSDLENKIYILDIEVGKDSGLEIAKKLRKTDWYSILVILTSHYELETVAYKSRILVFDFISKFDLYDKKVYETITLCVDNKLENSNLIIKNNRKIEQIKLSNILYITYDGCCRKTKIITKTKEYETYETLKDISNRLKGNFVFTHKSCIVNLNNVKTIDTKNKIITFENGIKTDLLSRTHIKDVKNYGNN